MPTLAVFGVILVGIPVYYFVANPRAESEQSKTS
jgi:hypothetical protein